MTRSFSALRPTVKGEWSSKSGRVSLPCTRRSLGKAPEPGSEMGPATLGIAIKASVATNHFGVQRRAAPRVNGFKNEKPGLKVFHTGYRGLWPAKRPFKGDGLPGGEPRPADRRGP